MESVCLLLTGALSIVHLVHGGVLSEPHVWSGDSRDLYSGLAGWTTYGCAVVAGYLNISKVASALSPGLALQSQVRNGLKPDQVRRASVAGVRLWDYCRLRVRICPGDDFHYLGVEEVPFAL